MSLLALLALALPLEGARPLSERVLPLHEVYYLEAPLFSSSFPGTIAPDVAIAAQAFHAGIAVRDRSNGSTRVWEYDAANGIVDGVFPEKSASSGLRWRNRGVVMELQNLNISYWTRASLQATIGDAQLQQFVRWISSYNRSAPDYSPFDVVDPSNHSSVLLRSQTCQDFAFDAIAHLQAMGAEVRPLVPSRKSRAILYSSQLTEVPDNDTGLVEYWRAASEIVQHLRTVHALASALELVGFLRLREQAFVRSAGRNYRLQLIQPYARWAYESPAHMDQTRS